MCVKPRPAYSTAVVHHGGFDEAGAEIEGRAGLSAGDPDRRGPLSRRAHQRQRVRPEDQAIGDAALARAGRHVAGEADRPRRQHRRPRRPGSLPDPPPDASPDVLPVLLPVLLPMVLREHPFLWAEIETWTCAGTPSKATVVRASATSPSARMRSGPPPPGRRSTASDPRRSRAAPAATRDRRRRRADTAPA